MSRAFSFPKLSLGSCLAIAIISFLFLIPNSTLATVTGTLKLTDASWQEKIIYRPGENMYIQVIDADEDEDNTAKDTLSVSVTSDTETAAETVTLTETGVNTGIFQGSIELNDQGSVNTDGKLQVTTGDKIIATYKDLIDDWGNSKNITKTIYFAATTVTGYISTDITWTEDKSPYFVTGDVIVESNVTLTIEPGVEIIFLAGMDDRNSGRNTSLSELQVKGTLNAIGTPIKRIRFTSSGDPPTAGGWDGIELVGSSKATIQYCDIRYGVYGIRLYGSYSGQVLVDNCIISDGSYAGIGYLGGTLGSARIAISNNRILRNNSHGISLYEASIASIDIKNNIISQNKISGISCGSCSASASIENNAIINNSYGIDNAFGSPIIKYNYISGNDYGIYSYTGGTPNYAEPVIAYNNIITNKGSGIYNPNYSDPAVNYNNIYNNGSYDFYNDSSVNNIDARYNYWGTKATAEMNSSGNPKNISTIWDYFDGGRPYGMVNYSNWLNSIILLPPTGIMSTPGDTTIDLSWTASEGAEGYYLYYGLFSGAYNSPIDVGNNTSYQLTGLSSNTTYYIALTTYDKDKKESTYSYELKLTTGEPPNIPTGLKATVDDKIVTIHWNANSESNLDHYNLYVGYAARSYNMEGSPFNVGKVTSISASDVPEGTYYLALSAVDSAGKESSLSEEIKVVVSTKPIITIASNQSSYSPGDTFSLSVSMSNPTSATHTVDVFLGIIAPDGSIFFFDSSLNNLVPADINDSRTFTPASTSLALSPGYDLPLTSFFSAILPSGLAGGTYQAFAALAKPGSVLAGLPKIIGNISFSSFTYSR